MLEVEHQIKQMVEQITRMLELVKALMQEQQKIIHLHLTMY